MNKAQAKENLIREANDVAKQAEPRDRAKFFAAVEACQNAGVSDGEIAVILLSVDGVTLNVVNCRGGK